MKPTIRIIMKEIIAYRCEHCGKLYMIESACSKHERDRCPKNPEIRPLCYSCEHYQASFDDGEKEKVEYGHGYHYDGSEYCSVKMFAPNRCKHPEKNCKLYNDIKLSDEMREGLTEVDFVAMPTPRSGGCSTYKPISNHPYAVKQINTI